MVTGSSFHIKLVRPAPCYARYALACVEQDQGYVTRYKCYHIAYYAFFAQVLMRVHSKLETNARPNRVVRISRAGWPSYN